MRIRVSSLKPASSKQSSRGSVKGWECATWSVCRYICFVLLYQRWHLIRLKWVFCICTGYVVFIFGGCSLNQGTFSFLRQGHCIAQAGLPLRTVRNLVSLTCYIFSCPLCFCQQFFLKNHSIQVYRYITVFRYSNSWIVDSHPLKKQATFLCFFWF